MEFEYRKRTFDIKGVSPDHHIYKKIVKWRSFYEFELLDYMYSIKKHLRAGESLAIDVGANIGNHSIFMRSFLADCLISVEPNPEVLPTLKRNLSRNIDRYSVYDCGLGAADSMGKIVMPAGSDGNAGAAQIDLSAGDNRILITTLDALVDDWKKTHSPNDQESIIKIDVEGRETDVNQGAEKTLQKDKPHLFIEASTPDAFHKLNDRLKQLGYKKISRWAANHVYHFCYNPSKSLIITVRFAEMLRPTRRIKAKLMRKIKA